MEGSHPAVKVEAVSKTVKNGDAEISILNAASLSVEKGEYVALMGPSGSGKSTLLGLIGGLDTPTHGSISVLGRDIGRLRQGEMARFRSRTVGFVFQQFSLIPTISVLDNVLLPAAFAGEIKAKRESAIELLGLMGLEKRKDFYPPRLSGGEQQRVAIARAILNGPEILLADEPTGNLDSKTGYQILELLDRLQQERGLTLFVVTHDSEVARRADRIIRLADGEIVEG